MDIPNHKSKYFFFCNTDLKLWTYRRLTGSYVVSLRNFHSHKHEKTTGTILKTIIKYILLLVNGL